MSARPFRALLHTLASLSVLRYSTYDADCDADHSESDRSDLALSLCGDTHTGIAQVCLRRSAVFGVGADGRVGGDRRIIQWMVAYGACDDPGGIERILVGGGPIVGGGTCVHVSGRWNNVGGASGSGRFCDGRFREHQRCGDSPIGMV